MCDIKRSGGLQSPFLQGARYPAKKYTLTDNCLDVIAGKPDQVVGKIQETYGFSKDEVEKQITEMASVALAFGISTDLKQGFL